MNFYFLFFIVFDAGVFSLILVLSVVSSLKFNVYRVYILQKEISCL